MRPTASSAERGLSSRHDYPRVVDGDRSPLGCGFSERWEPRPERSSEWRFCVDGERWRLAVLLDYHEFFGQPVTQRFACRGPLVPGPPRCRWDSAGPTAAAARARA